MAGRPFGEGQGNWWYNTTTGQITDAHGLEQWINVEGPGLSLAGPFPTRADAEAFKKAHEPTNPAARAVQAVAGPWGFVKAFAEHLADGKMWRSLGWIVLGIILMFLGMMLWLRKADVIPAAVPVPV